MKKVNVFLVMVCLFGIWLTSCVKDNETDNTKLKKIKTNSSAILINRLKTNSNMGSYQLFSYVGHKSSDCGGKCKYYNGVYFHADCQGYGSECSLSSKVNISKNIAEDPTDIYYTATGIYDYEPTEEESFNMPARSFYFINETFENGYIWINIPEQVLQRNKESNMFIYKEITFTVDPLFNNL